MNNLARLIGLVLSGLACSSVIDGGDLIAGPVDPRLAPAIAIWGDQDNEVTWCEGRCTTVVQADGETLSHRVKFKRSPDAIVGEWVRLDKGHLGKARAGGWNPEYFFKLKRGEDPPWLLDTSGSRDDLLLDGLPLTRPSEEFVEILDHGVCRLLDAPWRFAGQPLSVVFSGSDVRLNKYIESNSRSSAAKTVTLKFDYGCDVSMAGEDAYVRFADAELELLPNQKWSVSRWRTNVTVKREGHPEDKQFELSCDIKYADPKSAGRPNKSWVAFPVVDEVVFSRKGENGLLEQSSTMRLLEIGQRSIRDKEFFVEGFRVPELKSTSGALFWTIGVICFVVVVLIFWRRP